MVEHRDLYLRSLPSNFLSSLPWLFLSGVGVLAMVNAVFRVFNEPGSRGLLFVQGVALATPFAWLCVPCFIVESPLQRAALL